MIYFDNAATGGRKPDQVLTALTSAVKVCANPGRSGHKLSLSCAKLVHACRHALDCYFDGYGFDRAVFTKNCTEALNIALFGVLKDGDHVVTTCMEHNSVLRPLERMKASGKITFDVCPLHRPTNEETHCIRAEDILSRIQPNTRLIAVTTASNVTGATPPIAEIRSRIPKEILLLCDGAQGGGHLDLRMKQQGIDLLALAGHKGLFGVQGSGALLFSERVNPEPILFGGTGSISISLDMPDFYPDRLEAGTLSYPAILSLLEGIRYLSTHGKNSQNRLLMLTAYLISGLKKLPACTIYSKPNPCGIVAFSHARYSSEQLATILSNKYDIAVRGGLHCAPLMHEELGTLNDGLVRASFSHFNNEREIDKLLDALSALEQEEK